MDEQETEALAFHKSGGYAVVDLAAAPADENAAVRVAMDLAELCDRITWDEQLRVLVLCFDGTLKEFQPPDAAQPDRANAVSLVTPVARLRQPVIAAIRGDAAGLGLELALACDIRIGVENARFGLPQIREGRLPCNGGTQRLPRWIGLGRAMHLVLTGDLMRAEEACRAGLLHRVVPPGELLGAAKEMARDMAEKSPWSLSYAKEALHKGLDLTLDQGINMEMDLYLHLFTTSDRAEGIAAYKEKRKPEFKGD